jgi:hypothetical protein
VATLIDLKSTVCSPHSFSLLLSDGRPDAALDHAINDNNNNKFAGTKAGIPSVKEPHGLARSDGKRPDGSTMSLWLEGRSAT